MVSVRMKNQSGVSINLRTFFCLILFSAAAVAEHFLVADLTPPKLHMTAISIIIVVDLLIQLVMAKFIRIELYSFFVLFILFYFLLHFGQVIMLGLFPDYQYDYMSYVVVYMKDEELLSKTIVVCLDVINCFFAGGLLFHLRTVSVKQSAGLGDVRQRGILHSAKTVFYLLLPFRLFFDFSYLISAFSGGYRATMGGNLPGVFSAFATMWYVVVPIYYVEMKSKRAKKWFLFLISAYVAITMLTGRRGHVVIGLASLAAAALGEKDKIPLRKTFEYGAVCLLGLFFLDVVYEMRSGSIQAFLSEGDAMIRGIASKNIILETLGSFGETIFTPYLVLRGYGTSFSPFFGECFVKSLVSVVPDGLGVFKQLNNQAIFSRMLGTAHSIGGSFAGEMYYNFGPWYPLLSLVFGFIIGRASSTTSAYIKLGNSDKIVSSLSFCSLSLWWIRDNFGNLTRQYVWILLLFYFINWLFGYRRNTGR